jgi:hypothetical protein
MLALGSAWSHFARCMSRLSFLPAQLLVFALAATAGAQEAPKDSVRKFYKGLTFGSEAQFNPLTEILNEGFDMLRIENSERRLGYLNYGQAATNVWRSISHPDGAIRNYGGFWEMAKREILPLSLKPNHGQWLPNYTVHMLGSGMISARMTEWYEAHDVPAPFAFSFATMYAAHFINEAVEDKGRVGRPLNVDPIADLYLFDLAGILLYRTERMRRLMNNDIVELTNWAGQPAINAPEGTLENTTQEFVIRAKLPRTDMWRALIGFGVSSVAGVSYGKRDGVAVSLAGGADVVRNPIVDTLTDRRTVIPKPYGGVFVDRQGSLLFSMMLRDSKEVVGIMNLYPGVIDVKGYTTGLWAQLLRDGSWRFGIVPTWGLGLGQNQRRTR